MPVSPFRRANGGSLASGKAKRKPKPTSKAAHRKKKIKKRYSIAREEAQLAGVIPTTPDGAVRNERSQSAPLPKIVRQALRESWATPDAAKLDIVASLLAPFYEDIVVMDREGNQLRIPPSPKLLLELAQTLRLLDQTQWAREHPEEAGKASGGGNAIAVSVQTNLAAIEFLNKVLHDEDRSNEQTSTPVNAGDIGDGRFDGKVETSQAPNGN